MAMVEQGKCQRRKNGSRLRSGVFAGAHHEEIAGSLPFEQFVGLVFETELTGTLGNIGEKTPAQIIGQLLLHRRADIVVGMART